MPEPQRSHAVRILVEEARAANTCPALLTAHITTSRSTGNVLNNARRRARKRMLEEIPGMRRHILAKAFRRDLKRLRASELDKNKSEG